MGPADNKDLDDVGTHSNDLTKIEEAPDQLEGPDDDNLSLNSPNNITIKSSVKNICITALSAFPKSNENIYREN